MNSLVLVALKPRDNGVLLPLFSQLGCANTAFQRLLGMAINLPSLPSRADPGELLWNQLWSTVGDPGGSRVCSQGAALFGGLITHCERCCGVNSHLGTAWLLCFSKLFLCSQFLPLFCCEVGQSSKISWGFFLFLNPLHQDFMTPFSLILQKFFPFCFNFMAFAFSSWPKPAVHCVPQALGFSLNKILALFPLKEKVKNEWRRGMQVLTVTPSGWKPLSWAVCSR